MVVIEITEHNYDDNDDDDLDDDGDADKNHMKYIVVFKLSIAHEKIQRTLELLNPFKSVV